jgi:choline kinase
MDRYTVDRPKCLVELDGRPLLSWQLASLSSANPSVIGIVTGWQAHTLEDRGLTIFHNNAWSVTTMVDSLMCAEEWLLSDVTIVSYGDIIYGPAVVRLVAQSEAPISVAYDPNWRGLWERRFADPLSDAESFSVDESGYVLDIGQMPRSFREVKGQYMGVLRFTPYGWIEAQRIVRATPVEDRRRLDMTTLLRTIVMERRVPIAGVPTPGPWCEFDQPSDLEVGREIAVELARQEVVG